MLVIVDDLRVVIVVALALQVGVIHPAAEVTWLISRALSGSESGLDVGVIAHWMLACE